MYQDAPDKARAFRDEFGIDKEGVVQAHLRQALDRETLASELSKIGVTP